MDKSTVEFVLQVRTANDIGAVLLNEVDEMDAGPGVKTSMGDMLSCSLGVLVHRRDNMGVKYTFKAFMELCEFENLLRVTQDPKLPQPLRLAVRNYMRELTGFPRDVFDKEGNCDPEQALGTRNFGNARGYHDKLRELLIKPAIAAGLLPRPAAPAKPAAAAPGAAPKPAGPSYTLRPMEAADKAMVEAQICKHWAEPNIAYVDSFIDTAPLAGIVAIEGNTVIGSLTWRPHEGMLHIVTLVSEREKRGIGSALLKEAEAEATRQKLPGVLVSTENSNILALSFYQKRGYVMHRLHPNVLDLLRRQKPSIPRVAANKIPLRDQIDLIKDLF
jgi:ribosomal protein S18 acetylase RimI-like enzyme